MTYGVIIRSRIVLAFEFFLSLIFFITLIFEVFLMKKRTAKVRQKKIRKQKEVIK